INRERCLAGIAGAALFTVALPTVSRETNSSWVSFFAFAVMPLSMDHFGNPACSVLLRPGNKGRLSWRPLHRDVSTWPQATDPACPLDVRSLGVKRTRLLHPTSSGRDPSRHFADAQ